MILNALDWKLILVAAADRVYIVDWRISEYELVDDNEASHVDKPVVIFQSFIYEHMRFVRYDPLKTV